MGNHVEMKLAPSLHCWECETEEAHMLESKLTTLFFVFTAMALGLCGSVNDVQSSSTRV